MRLTDEQRNAIVEEAARVRLFGSRVDDNVRGGDIDLHVETEGSPAELLDRELKFHVRLIRRLGDRRHGHCRASARRSCAPHRRAGVANGSRPVTALASERGRLTRLPPLVERACRFTDHMHADYVSIRRYAATHLGIEPGP
jgi:hypothetical protein